MTLHDEAVAYIKANKKSLVKKLTSKTLFPPSSVPITIFMAGSPGAGKTEIAESLIEQNASAPVKRVFVHIDADQIRELIPGYTGANSHEVQGAAALAVEKLYDAVMHNGQHAVIDATFADYQKSHDNICRAINKRRVVLVLYIYQEPKAAWDFTQAREAIEGRHIDKEKFIEIFVAAQNNIRTLIEDTQLSDKITVMLVKQNHQNQIQSFHDIQSITDIDTHISTTYTTDSLRELLK